MSRIVLVTGASRGLGRELCRQLEAEGDTVIAAARDPRQVTHGTPLALDLLDPGSLAAAAGTVRQHHRRVDVLIACAAILLDRSGPLMAMDPDLLRRTLDTNVTAQFALVRAFWDLLPEGGRVLLVSSQAGQLEGMDPWAPLYSLSKTALNALMVQLSLAGAERGIAVNSACPGWVRTDMGGPDATLSVEEGARNLRASALELPQGTTGGFWHGTTRLPW